MAGFCESAIGLPAPKLAAAGAKSPTVSGGYLKYSRFRETATGDWVRSGLRGRAAVGFCAILQAALAQNWEGLLVHCVPSGIGKGIQAHCAMTIQPYRIAL